MCANVRDYGLVSANIANKPQKHAQKRAQGAVWAQKHRNNMVNELRVDFKRWLAFGELKRSFRMNVVTHRPSALPLFVFLFAVRASQAKYEVTRTLILFRTAYTYREMSAEWRVGRIQPYMCGFSTDRFSFFFCLSYAAKRVPTK